MSRSYCPQIPPSGELEVGWKPSIDRGSEFMPPIAFGQVPHLPCSRLWEPGYALARQGFRMMKRDIGMIFVQVHFPIESSPSELGSVPLKNNWLCAKHPSSDDLKLNNMRI